MSGANFRKSTSRTNAFPAALQDALTAYAHLVIDLGYRDILLAGDSAGGNLALMLLQYLTTTFSPAKTPSLVPPSGLLLLSPWCDLTAATFGRSRDREIEHDIITASMASNSLRALMYNVRSPLPKEVVRVDADGVYEHKARHPWFSPSLPTSLPALKAVARAYAPPDSGKRSSSTAQSASSESHPSTAPRPLRFLIATGTAELFSPEILNLVTNLEAASRAVSPAPSPSREPFRVETVVAEGEVHAFPLVPEWVSPAAERAGARIREWVLDGTGRVPADEARKAGRGV